MIANKRITIDLLSAGKVDTVQTVQGDAYSRTVEIDLRQGRKPWAIPDGVSVMVEYVKPDGTKGLYDTLPDSTQAWSADGNILTIHIAPQMLTVNGSVATQVSITKDSARLSLFKFWVYVNQKITGAESEDYINWRSAFLPQVEGAKAGQYFEIEEVDSAGRVVKVKAVDAPQGGSGQADWNASEGEPGFIANRTHWVDGEGASDTVEWDGDLTGREIAVDSEEGGEFGVVKLSDCYLTMEQLDGAVLTLTSPDGDETVTLSVEMMTDTSEMLGVPGVAVNEYLFSLSDSVTSGGMALTRGLWGTFMTSGGQTIAYIKSIKATAPIFCSETIHKLDNKFIDSEWMATYEEGIAPEITWDRSLDGREHYTRTEDYDDGAYATQVIVKMSDIVPSDEELKAATIEFVVRSPVDGGVASRAVADLWPLMESTDRITEKYIKVAYIEREDDGYTTLDLALVIKEETNASEIFDAPEIQAVLTPGVYFYDYKANSSTVSLEFYPKKLTVSGPGLAPIPVPEKFLPTTVPVIQSATPGQTIVVKSVDDSGKPTEWEAVDLPDSSQNANLTTAQINALDGMFKVCAYNGDPSDAYTAFKAAFGISDSGGGEEPDIPDDPTVKTYSISKELVNVTSNNSATSVSEGASYTATLSASDGYTLDGATVTVTMGGVDITSTAYVSGVISIASVTGNVEIFASAAQIEEVPAELITDGLVFNYDFRNAVMESYNLSGWGGVYRTVDKTGNAMIFGGNAATGDDKGLANYPFRGNRLVSSETQEVRLGESYTVQALYRQNTSRVQPSLLGWASGLNIGGTFRIIPKYLVGTTETSATAADYAHEDTLYTVVTYVANGASLTIYHNTDIVLTDDGSNYEGFTKWVDYGVPNTIYNNGYSTAFVGYNRALTQQEIIENIAFFKTMEVSE